MKILIVTLICLTSLWSLDEGELKFSIGGKQYVTTNAQGLVQIKKGKARIYIAVKDIESRFMLVLTADVPQGQETQQLNLNTADSSLTASLRTRNGTFAVMPQVQLAKVDQQISYVESTHVDTGELEDDTDDKADKHSGERTRKKRKKIRSEYKRVKPRWHTMNSKERIKSGEGVIENNSFRDTYFALQLTPVLSQGKVVSYSGTFAGSGRFSNTVSGSEVRPIKNGVFRVRVENVQ
jgi:hypothetical protein